MTDKLPVLDNFISHSWPVFPVWWMNDGRCFCGDASCKSPGKHPLVEGGFKAASLDNNVIRNWDNHWPEAYWAIRTGNKNDGGAGIVVIDIDNKTGGFATWDILRDENPGAIETVSVSTGNGGQHLYFKYPEDCNISSRMGALGPGVDVKADGGYVLIPPSKTVQTYRFELHPDDTPISDLPGWIKSKLNGRGPAKKESAGKRIGEVVEQGNRHQALVSIAGNLHNSGFTDDEIRAALKVIRDERFSTGDHPVSDDEINNVVNWIATTTSRFPFTDLGNAERFCEQHKEEVRFCFEWEKWLSWDGKRWAIDNIGEIKRRSHETVRSIYAEATNAESDEKRKAIAKHALHSEARAKVENMLFMASPYMETRPDELDQHPMLLNVSNGIIGLKTGELLPHDKKYMLTKIIDVAYDPKAECPEFEKSLNLITGGDVEQKYYLQKSVGYTLTGLTDEHCLFFLYGPGLNGKTVFMETIRRLLGDYAQRIDIEALMQSWNMGAQATPHVAAMAGSRFVLASEVAENRKLNESLTKDLTGGDSMSARFLFSNPFTFTPTHKLWIFGNYKPKVSGTDWGFWRRIRVIPFSVTIPESVRKPMGTLLEIFDNEMPGILAWAVTGCLMWQSDGLDMPESVRTATQEYRTEQDLVQQFINEKCEQHPDYSVGKDNLYASWKSWCDDQGEKEALRHSKKWLTHQMTDRGFDPTGQGRSFLKGIRIKA